MFFGLGAKIQDRIFVTLRHLTDLGNTMAFECFVLLCMYKPPAEVYTYKIKRSEVCETDPYENI